MMRRLLVWFIPLLFSCSSQDQQPRNLIQPEEFEKVFWDVIEVNTYAKNYLLIDSSREYLQTIASLEKGVFEKHKTSKETFYESYEYYMKHPSILSNLMDSMLVHQKSREIDESRKGKSKRKEKIKLELNE